MDSTPFERAMDEIQKLRVEVERLREAAKLVLDAWEGYAGPPFAALRSFDALRAALQQEDQP